jgi:hypothetical protein
MRYRSTLTSIVLIGLVAVIALPLCFVGGPYGALAVLVSVMGIAVAFSLRSWFFRS